jgi:hypothetical protein
MKIQLPRDTANSMAILQRALAFKTLDVRVLFFDSDFSPCSCFGEQPQESERFYKLTRDMEVLINVLWRPLVFGFFFLGLATNLHLYIYSPLHALDMTAFPLFSSPSFGKQPGSLCISPC